MNIFNKTTSNIDTNVNNYDNTQNITTNILHVLPYMVNNNNKQIVNSKINDDKCVSTNIDIENVNIELGVVDSTYDIDFINNDENNINDIYSDNNQHNNYLNELHQKEHDFFCKLCKIMLAIGILLWIVFIFIKIFCG